MQFILKGANISWQLQRASENSGGNNKMKKVILSVVVLMLAVDTLFAQRDDRKKTVEEAIEIVSHPRHGFGSMSPSELQTTYRLRNLRNYATGYYYHYKEADKTAWKSLMLDEKKGMYASLCAAFMLLDDDKEARIFVETQARSKNLRHRYNAAKVVEMYVGRDASQEWGVNLLIALLADGSLDGSGIKSSPGGEFPDGDRNDVMHTPIDGICRDFGFMKLTKAVPSLIGVLERRPETGDAAFALGEIGDQTAIPILMKILRERAGREEITALGKLKCKEAVPILTGLLGKLDSPFSGSDDVILEAILAIGDERAVPSIKEYLKGAYPKKSKAVAKRVLVQLTSKDPVADLLSLLRTEEYEPERSNIIDVLSKYKDERVIKEFANLARTSDSAFMRREAICSLRDIGNRDSLLVLASLLDVKFSKNFKKAKWGGKGEPPDFSKYFPETIQLFLKQKTNQDFGANRRQWEKWIQENVRD
jgi:hypothetical protein